MAAAIKPTEFAPGKTFGTGTMTPADYLVALAEGRIAPPSEPQHPDGSAAAELERLPLPLRAVCQPPRGRVEEAGLHRDARRLPDAQRALEILGRRPARRLQELGRDRRRPQSGRMGRQGIDERIMLRELLRRVDMMVMYENKLDLLVRLHTPLPPGKIGGAPWPEHGRQRVGLRAERGRDRGADPGRIRSDGL